MSHGVGTPESAQRAAERWRWRYADSRSCRGAAQLWRHRRGVRCFAIRPAASGYFGLRASTITDVNGVETFIPNSTFIEQNLTNWTYTSGRIRFNVKVGVAYGSPVRVVTQLLEEIAARHGKVLKHPAPEVLFEDVGSDALLFSLYYWLDVGGGTSSRQVAGDLRAMIEAALAAQGIATPYPQRDLHLDATSPVPVRIVPVEGAAAPPAPPLPRSPGGVQTARCQHSQADGHPDLLADKMRHATISAWMRGTS